MRTFLIATGGIRAGKVVPLELATDGLLEVPAEPNFEALGGVWVFPTQPRPIEIPQRRDALVRVKGITLKASTAAPQVRVHARVNVVGCQDDDEALIMCMAHAALEEYYLQRIVDIYSGEEPEDRDILICALEELEDHVDELQSEIRRLRSKGA